MDIIIMKRMIPTTNLIKDNKITIIGIIRVIIINIIMVVNTIKIIGIIEIMMDIKNIDYIKSQATKYDSKILTSEKDYIKIKIFKNDDIKHLKIELDIKNEDKLIDYLKTHI